MINYRYNETKYALKILESGFVTKYHVYELKILAKYLKHKGFKPKQRKELIYEFCQKHIEKFNRVLYFKTINSVINYSNKKESNLVDISNIDITETELEFIINSDLPLNEKKILFTLIVMNKINKRISMIMFGVESKHDKFGGKKTNYRDLLNASKLNGKENIATIIHNLYIKGYLDIETGFRKDNGKVKLIYLDRIKQCDSTAIKVETFDNIGLYFDYYMEDTKVKKCDKCGTLIRITSNRTKYCKLCSTEINRLDAKNRMQKMRSRNVTF